LVFGGGFWEIQIGEDEEERIWDLDRIIQRLIRGRRRLLSSVSYRTGQFC